MPPSRLRGLLALLSASMVVDTAAYSAITPLLPHFVAEYELSRLGAGLLTAAYPVGTVLLALPAAWLVSRIGPKRVILLALGLMALASSGFAFATAAPALALARLVQGAGAAGVWAASLAWAISAAPRSRRSEVIGVVTGAAIIGAVGGPGLGVLGDWFGVRAVFATFVVVPVTLAVLVARLPPPPVVKREGALAALLTVGHDARMRLGLWLMIVPAVGFGVIALLLPLRLDARGWSASAIGAVFLVTAVVEAVAAPVAGRASDRFGPLTPAWVALGGTGIGMALLAPRWPVAALAVLMPLTGAVMGSLWTPAMTLLSTGAEDRGLDPAFGFGMANLAWGVGAGVGNIGGGGAAQLAGDWSAFVVVAVVALAMSAVVRRRARHPLMDSLV